MTKDQAIEALKKAKAKSSTEEAHIAADEVLCELLTELGYADVVDEYNKVGRWFA